MQNDNKELFDFLEKIYELKINSQSGAVDSIEAKAGQLLTGIGIFLPLALALITNSTQINFNYWIVTGCITSLICIIICGIVLKAKIFKIRPNFKAFYSDVKDLSSPEMRKEAIKDMQKALDDNNGSLEWKGWFFNVMVLFFCASVLFISWGILVQKINFSYNTRTNIGQFYGKQSRQPTKPTTNTTAGSTATASAKSKQ